MAKKDSMFNIAIDPANVMYTNITSSKDGYNSARMVVKAAEKEYMSISYEWEGGGIPGFAMDMMDLMKKNGMENSRVRKGLEEEYAEYMNEEAKRKCGGKGGKGKDKAAKMCPNCGLVMDTSVPKEQRCTCKEMYDNEDHDNPENEEM